MLTTVKTKSGLVSGVAGTHTAVFRGIPYASAARFCPPGPAPRWEGVRPCTQFAPRPLQQPPKVQLPYQDFYTREYGVSHAPMAEDSLCLNIWTPAETPGDRLPVLVFLHYGGYFSGCGNETPFDGEALAEQGVILVTLNHRIGYFAYFAHPLLSARSAHGTSGNNDLRDQQAALRWVRENIANFGGDPDNITLIGQSTGGGSVASQLFIPSSEGLFHKAAIHSGLGVCRARTSLDSLEDAEAWGMQVCRLTNTSLEQLETMSAPALLDLFAYADTHGAGSPPVHVADGAFLPVHPGRAIRAAARPEIPLLLLNVAGDHAADPEVELCRARAAAGGQTHLAFFHPEIPGHNATGIPDGIAYHGADLWFLFGTLSRCWRPYTDAHRALSRRMTEIWADFARTGAPAGWTPFSRAGEWVLDLDDRAPYGRMLPLEQDDALQELLLFI